MAQNKQFILFDFGGVIADSFQPAFEVEKMICPHLTEDAYRNAFNGNINDWEKPNHTENCRLDLDFFELYIPKMKEGIGVVSGMDKIIEELAKLYKLVIISSTLTSPIQDFIDKFDLSKHFLEIMGNDVRESKVEKIKMVFQKYGAEAAQCVFITDTLGDMLEATKASVGAIGVSWGFQHQETLERGNPFRIVGAPQELPTAIRDYFQRELSQ